MLLSKKSLSARAALALDTTSPSKIVLRITEHWQGMELRDLR